MLIVYRIYETTSILTVIIWVFYHKANLWNQFNLL